jgi:hypothetical protein
MSAAAALSVFERLVHDPERLRRALRLLVASDILTEAEAAEVSAAVPGSA